MTTLKITSESFRLCRESLGGSFRRVEKARAEAFEALKEATGMRFVRFIDSGVELEGNASEADVRAFLDKVASERPDDDADVVLTLLAHEATFA